MAMAVVVVLLLLPILLLFLALRLSLRWRHPHLPAGSLGLPILGETLHLISAYKTDNPEPFVDARVRRHGRVFTTHVFGEPTVFVTDPDSNRFVLQSEGRLFESSYPGSISTLLGRRSLLIMKQGQLHKKLHSLTINFAGAAMIRDHLLPDIDRLVRYNLEGWDGSRIHLQDETKKAYIDHIYLSIYILVEVYDDQTYIVCLILLFF